MAGVWLRACERERLVSIHKLMVGQEEKQHKLAPLVNQSDEEGHKLELKINLLLLRQT